MTVQNAWIAKCEEDQAQRALESERSLLGEYNEGEGSGEDDDDRTCNRFEQFVLRLKVYAAFSTLGKFESCESWRSAMQAMGKRQ